MAKHLITGLAIPADALPCLLLGVLLYLLIGCKAEPEPAPPPPPPPTPINESQRAELETFKRAGTEQFEQLIECNKNLKTLTERFLLRVSATVQAKVQQQLAACVSRYKSTRLLLPYPEALGQRFQQIHQDIYSHVSLPGYVDSLPNHPNSGIVHDLSLSLDRSNLRAQQFFSNDQEVALGYGVLALLLEQPLPRLKAVAPWAGSPDPDTIADHPNNRRRHYLQLLLIMLIEDSGKLADLWRQKSLPEYQKTALRWREQQLNRLEASLKKNTVDLVLAKQIYRWLDQGAIPALSDSNRQHQPKRILALLQRLNLAGSTPAESLPQ